MERERHTWLWTGKKFERAQYTGPGTALLTRLKRKDPGITETDVISKAHDVGYTLAKNPNEVRVADRKMLLALSESKDYKVNTFPAYSAIRAKMTMEDLGIIGKDFFTTFGGFEQLPTEDQLLLLETEKNLT